MNVVTKDGLVHTASNGPEGATTLCGRHEQVYTTEGGLRLTCPECSDKVVCPKCQQLVELEVLYGRRRKVTMTKVHIKPGPAAVVCHAILSTEETR